MQFFKRNPVFYTVLCLLMAICFVGLWYLSQLSEELQTLKANYQTKSDQYDRYIQSKPSPTKTNLRALEANYEQLYRVYEDTMRILNLNTYEEASFFGQTPDSRAAWFYEINKYVAGAKYEALSNGVEVPPLADFGFDDYADFVPTEEEGPTVHKQVVIMTHLLRMLFEAGIEEFGGIERGQLHEGKQTRRKVDTKIEGGFRIAESASIAIPEVFHTYPFRLTFKGQSNALRAFLNSVAESAQPYAVRGVEVELASESGTKSQMGGSVNNPFSRSGGTSSSVPIISDNTSIFVVTVEFIDLIVEVKTPSATAEGGGDA